MLTREEIRAVYEGPEAMIALVERLCAQIAELAVRVKELEDRLATNSRNSSKRAVDAAKAQNQTRLEDDAIKGYEQRYAAVLKAGAEEELLSYRQ
jgi:hypothetical protein